jgi:hypothetical protein
MIKTQTPKRPTHRVYAVTKNGDKSFWTEIDAADVFSNVAVFYYVKPADGNIIRDACLDRRIRATYQGV